MPDPVDLVSDERGQRLQTIVEDSDTLLIPSLRVEYSFSVADEPASEDTQAPAAACTGVSCTIGTGTDTTIMVQHILDLSAGVGPGEATLGQSGGFDTLESAGRLRLGETLLGEDFSVLAPSVTNYGLWGQYGFAGVSIGTGTLEGTFQLEELPAKVPISGNVAMAFAAGDTNGLNPGGVGEAIWEGIAEAVSTRTFQRRTGTARVLISNLSDPMANVYIRLDETLVGPTDGWTNMPVTDGGFSSGTAGTDLLQGNFHGPVHEEAYGVFDTDAYTGAFGAMRGN